MIISIVVKKEFHYEYYFVNTIKTQPILKLIISIEVGSAFHY